LKNILVLGLGLLVDDIRMRVGFAFFWIMSSVNSGASKLRCAKSGSRSHCIRPANAFC